VASLGLLLLLGMGLGLINNSISRYFPFWISLSGLTTRGMLFLSGVMQIAALYPPTLRQVISWNPVLHAIELFRIGLYGNYPTIIDLPYLLKSTVVLLCIGVVADRATLRRGGQ
jgi:capsular polysaccharide transport system permease protein